MKVRTQIALVLALLAALLATATPVAAVDEGFVEAEEVWADKESPTEILEDPTEILEDPTEILEDPAEILAATSEILANSSELSVDEAKAVFTHQAEVDRVAAVLSEQFPSRYGGSYTSQMTPPRSTILIKGGADSEVRRTVEAILPEGVEFAATNYAIVDWLTIRDQAHDLLLADDHDFVSVGINPMEGRLEVEVSRSGVDAETLAESIRMSSGVEVDPDQILVTTNSGAGFTDHSAYGGEALYDGSARECSSAFAATRNSNGAGGLLTAAHCNGLDGYEHHWGTTHSLSIVNQHNGSDGDFEFHTTDTTEYDRFYFAHTSLMDVGSVQPHSGMDVNDWVCVWGDKTSTGVCVQVNTIFTTMTASGITAGDQIRTNPCGTDGGDSGGPWYTGTSSGVAWGIHKGSLNSDNDCSFSTVVNAQSRLGVTVMQ